MKGRALEAGHRRFVELPAHEALAFIYTCMVDTLRSPWGQLYKLLDAIELFLTTPWLLTDETWGTGRAAEEATQAWESQFPMASAAPTRAPGRRREDG